MPILSLPPLIPQSQTRRLASFGSFDPTGRPTARGVQATQSWESPTARQGQAMLASSRRALQLTPALTPLGLLSAPARSARDASWDTAPCPLPPLLSASFSLRRETFRSTQLLPPAPSHLRNPSDRAPPTGYWDLANPELSSLTRRHALRADALQHLWEACHAGGYACGHPSPPPLSIPSHSRWVEAPASRELGEGALWLAPALRLRFQVARGPCTLHFFRVIANSGPRKQSK